ncbi:MULTISPECIES: YraN family protein [Chitinophagaceae]
MKGCNHHIQTGKEGEHHAASHLLQLGFSLLAKNWRYHRLEVDLIASKDGILHFIEVKTRTTTKFGLPEAAVSEKKMAFLKEAASAYQTLYPQWKKVQFDVIAIQLHFNHIKEIYINWDVYF